MRALKALAVLGLIATGLAFAQNGPFLASKTFTFSCPTDGGSCTGSAPTSSTDGVSLSEATGYQVAVAVPVLPDAGQPALSGGGTLACYYLAATNSSGVHGSSVTRQWARCKSSMDVSDLSEAAGRTAFPWPQVPVAVGAGRVKFVPSALTHDGGGVPSGVMDVNVTVEVQRGGAGR
jgi:hypothetical protein